MYSPKIDEDLIPYLYQLAKFLRLPMTKVVSVILREVVESLKQKGCYQVLDEVARQQEAQKRLTAHFSQLFARAFSELDLVIDLTRLGQQKTRALPEGNLEAQVKNTKDAS